MESAKEEAIRESYGEHWEELKDLIDENGWLYDFDAEYLLWEKQVTGRIYSRVYFIDYELQDGGTEDYIRPKSLQGIETNNGWTRIESEADLPETRGKNDVWLLEKYTGEIVPASTNLLNSEEVVKFWVSNASHYQPIVKPNLPIY